MTNISKLAPLMDQKMKDNYLLSKKEAFVESYTELNINDPVLYEAFIIGATMEERRKQKKKRYKK